ncbi:MAG: hypothetical protein ABI610_00210 [Acidobacteriota bacterium]
MPQTRMFRDRVVSMEQTLEGGEKHLELLKGLCREALPEFEHASHALDHERDTFVMELVAPDGRRRLVAWTRMVLFDAERIPTLSAGAGEELRAKIVQYIRARANRPEIVVTFRHLEEGWVDTPEPRRDKRRRRRGGRGGEARAGSPEKTAGRPRGAPPQRPRTARPARPPGPVPAPAQAQGQPPPASQSGGPRPEAPRPDGKRRRFRRRRRGRGSGGGGPQGPAAPPA